MNDKATGIVIKQIDYKDNDAIITVYCPEYDKVSLYVKGYKKITSKNVYATQLFDESAFLFDYNPAKGFQILKSASLIREHAPIKADYDKTVIASLICEVADELWPEGGYSELKSALDMLDDYPEIYTVLNLYLAQALKQAGIGPNVDGCSICGSTEGIEAVSMSEGGFVCHNCNSQLHLPVSEVGYLRQVRIINKASFEVADKLIGLGLDSFQLTELLMSFMNNYLDANFRSYKSLVNLHK